MKCAHHINRSEKNRIESNPHNSRPRLAPGDKKITSHVMDNTPERVRQGDVDNYSQQYNIVSNQFVIIIVLVLRQDLFFITCLIRIISKSYYYQYY